MHVEHSQQWIASIFSKCSSNLSLSLLTIPHIAFAIWFPCSFSAAPIAHTKYENTAESKLRILNISFPFIHSLARIAWWELFPFGFAFADYISYVYDGNGRTVLCSTVRGWWRRRWFVFSPSLSLSPLVVPCNCTGVAHGVTGGGGGGGGGVCV